jgi:transcriptional regulator with XRE-family HTH domain
METAREILSHNLRFWRKQRGLTQARLGEIAGMSLQVVQSAEAMTRWPSPETIASLARALTIPEAFLFNTAFELPPPSLDDAMKVVNSWYKSMSLSRRKLLDASTPLDDAEVMRYANMMTAQTGATSGPLGAPKRDKPQKKAD